MYETYSNIDTVGDTWLFKETCVIVKFANEIRLIYNHVNYNAKV